MLGNAGASSFLPRTELLTRQSPMIGCHLYVESDVRLGAPVPPHLNVDFFCSLLRVRKSLEASLANIEMGVPGALPETVGSKIPSSVAIYAKVDRRHCGSSYILPTHIC